jgi:hypothetical protein
MRRSSRLAIAFALVALVSTAACSSDDEGLSKEEQEYADVISADMRDDEAGMDVTQEEADCMGEAVMAELGTDPFEEKDLEPKDLEGDETPGQLLGEGAVSDDQAGTIADAWTDCSDLPKALTASLTDSMELDDEEAQCVEDGLGKGDIVTNYLKTFFTSETEPTPSDPDFKALLDLVTDCTAEEDGSGGLVVDGIAQSLAASGAITEDQAQCMAQSIVDEIGADAILEASSDPSADLEAQMNQAVLTAAEGCGVSPEQMAGG